MAIRENNAVVEISNYVTQSVDTAAKTFTSAAASVTFSGLTNLSMRVFLPEMVRNLTLQVGPPLLRMAGVTGWGAQYVGTRWVANSLSATIVNAAAPAAAGASLAGAMLGGYAYDLGKNYAIHKHNQNCFEEGLKSVEADIKAGKIVIELKEANTVDKPTRPNLKGKRRSNEKKRKMAKYRKDSEEFANNNIEVVLVNYERIKKQEPKAPAPKATSFFSKLRSSLSI